MHFYVLSSCETQILYLIIELTNYTGKFKNINDVIDYLNNTNDDTKNLEYVEEILDVKQISNVISRTINQVVSSADIDSLSSVFKTSPLRNNDFGIENGDFGVLYGLNYLGVGKDNFENIKDEIIERYTFDSNIPPGLYNGKSGVAWALSEMKIYDKAYSEIKKANNDIYQSENYTIQNGLAGNALTNLYFYLNTNEVYYLNHAIDITEIIIDKKFEDKETYFWKNEMSETENGYMNGSSGIALLFIYLYKTTDNKKYLDYAKKSINYDLNQINSHLGGTPSLISSVSGDTIKVTPYLTAGTAGLLSALCRIIKYGDSSCSNYVSDLEYLLKDCLRIFTVYPSLFMGMSGIGNTLIDIYQLLNYDIAIKSAESLAKTILSYEIRVDEDDSGFPGIQFMRVSNDFGTGSIGVILFLDRLIKNKKDFLFTIDSYF